MKPVIKSFLPIFILLVLLTQTGYGCEKNTNNASEAYKLWAGEEPLKEVQVLNGKYWQSSHWTKEYILYLDLMAPTEWREAFIRQNNLVENKKQINLPPDAPDWFKPTNDYRVLAPPSDNQGSVYYENQESGEMFIYEIQL